jgi:hypothetical protein
MVGRARLLAALTVGVAVLYGVEVGSYWLTDAVVFAVVAVAVAFLCFAERGVDSLLDVLGFGLARASRGRVAKTRGTEGDQTEHLPRSRIAHYVIVSRIKSTSDIAKRSDTPFERALLSEPGWRTLSGRSLDEIAKKIPKPSAKSAQ